MKQMITTQDEGLQFNPTTLISSVLSKTLQQEPFLVCPLRALDPSELIDLCKSVMIYM